MKMWLSRSLFPILLVLPLLVNADLPSCYRARCTHCRIQFIAQMCPQTCTNCPEQAFSGKVCLYLFVVGIWSFYRQPSSKNYLNHVRLLRLFNHFKQLTMLVLL